MRFDGTVIKYGDNVDTDVIIPARYLNTIDKKELAIKKYKKIIHSHSESAIVPISEYNMAYLLFEAEDSSAKRHYKRIVKKYPQSDYATASEYYLGILEMKNPPKNKKRLRNFSF